MLELCINRKNGHWQVETLGHFDALYGSVNGLVDHFTQQLDKVRAKTAIQASKEAGTAPSPT